MGSRWWQLSRVTSTSQRGAGGPQLLRGRDARCGVQSGAWKDDVRMLGVCSGRNRNGNSSGAWPYPFLGKSELELLTLFSRPLNFTVHQHVNKSRRNRVRQSKEFGVKKIDFVSIFHFPLVVITNTPHAPSAAPPAFGQSREMWLPRSLEESSQGPLRYK